MILSEGGAVNRVLWIALDGSMSFEDIPPG